MRDVFLAKYPSPPRARVGFGADDSEKVGFHFVGQEDYQNLVRFTVDTLVDYLVTQSNVIASVEGIGEVYAGKLKAAGVRSAQTLLAAGATPKGRQEIAARSGIGEALILRWMNHVDLFRIKGVGEE